ncbi:MAG: DUF4399 domain-containing protein [Gammaproteobacteria bacterium]|nr:DUF4399 domain-containing protein [Gammaproteobacteria bacterium]
MVSSKQVISLGLSVVISALAGLAQAASPSPAGAEVSIMSPKDGDVVTSPVKVVFGVKGMVVDKAGSTQANSGHHHLIIDADLPAADQPIGKDAQHVHFGAAQTEATVELPKGKHTLQLMFADGAHMPHAPVVASKKITIEVK